MPLPEEPGSRDSFPLAEAPPEGEQVMGEKSCLLDVAPFLFP